MVSSSQICNVSHGSLPGIRVKISSRIALNTPGDLDLLAGKLHAASLIPAGAQGTLRFRLDGENLEDATLIPLP